MPDGTAGTNGTNGTEGTGRQDVVPHSTAGDDQEPEGAVPPGYDWPTHGGYLGCMLGLVAACLVGGFIGSSLFAALTKYNWAPGVVTALIVVVVYAVAIGALSALGWMLGKRFYRAYPQSRGRTWGEHDDADEQLDRGDQSDQSDQGEWVEQDEQNGAIERADIGAGGTGDASGTGVTGEVMGAEGREMPASARASAAESPRDTTDERAGRDGKR